MILRPILCSKILTCLRPARQFPSLRAYCYSNCKISTESESIKKTLASMKQDDRMNRMLIGFTCKPCDQRSHHLMSKLAYEQGTVLIECPGCKSRHLIADHLNWFDCNQGRTIEDIMNAKGEKIQKTLVISETGCVLELEPSTDTA